MTTRGNTRTQFLHLLQAKYPVFSTALTEGDSNTARGKESEKNRMDLMTREEKLYRKISLLPYHTHPPPMHYRHG